MTDLRTTAAGARTGPSVASGSGHGPSQGRAPDARPLEPPWLRRYRRQLQVLDLALALIAMVVVAASVDGAAALAVFGDVVPPRAAVAIVAAVVFQRLLAWAGAYSGTLGAGSEEFTAMLRAAVVFVALAAVLEFVVDCSLSRRLVFAGTALTVALVGVARYVTRRSLHRRRAEGRDCHRVLVLGPAAAAVELARHLEASRYVGFHVVGLRPDAPTTPGGLPDVALESALPGVVMRPTDEPVEDAVGAVDADVVAVAGGRADGVRNLAWSLEGTGIGLVVAPDVVDVAGPRLRVHPVAGLPLLELSQPRLSRLGRIARSAYDRGLALLIGLVTSPLWIVAAVAVAVSSHGPVLYRQRRVGLGGREFTMYKLRSMVVGADQMLPDVEHGNSADGPLFKHHTDPRVTAVGRVLRRWSLDEIPQLLNVLKGDMALVGPRPPLPREVERYQGDAHRRLLVKPGLTGLWQVSGRADLPWDEAVRLDLYYIDNWSPALDALILWKTVFAVVRRDGAY